MSAAPPSPPPPDEEEIARLAALAASMSLFQSTAHSLVTAR